MLCPLHIRTGLDGTIEIVGIEFTVTWVGAAVEVQLFALVVCKV